MQNDACKETTNQLFEHIESIRQDRVVHKVTYPNGGASLGLDCFMFV